MDPPEICKEHNLPVVFYQPNPNNQKGAICLTCLQKLTGLIPGETYQQIQQLINQSKLQNNYDKKLIENIVNSIIQFKKSFNNSLDKIIKILLDQIEVIDSFMKKMENIFDDKFTQLVSLEQIQKECEDQTQSNQSIINISKQELQDLKQDFSKMDISYTPLLKSKIITQPIQLMKGMISITDFVFSEQGNILLVVNYREIYVYQFECGIASKQLQKLTHKDFYAKCVKFMKHSNQFVSCGQFEGRLSGKQFSTLIWERNALKCEWFVKHELKLKLEEAFLNECEWCYFSIIINNQEDFLISTNSKVVSIWRKHKSWLFIDQWKCEQSIEGSLYHKLSLNDSENTIITGVLNYSLFILKPQNNKRWECIQVIKGQFSSPCFTIGDQFVAINYQSNLLEVYDYDKNLKQFALLKQITVAFDRQYKQYNRGNTFFKSKSILAIPNRGTDMIIHFFKVDKAHNYQLMQNLLLDNKIYRFTFSDSGDYLITLNDEFELMKLEYLE